MTATELNRFLRVVAGSVVLQARLRSADAPAASALAHSEGFEVSVGDLIRYKARATSWKLRDDELEVVAMWQPSDQPFWWQYIWPTADVDSQPPEGDHHG